MYTPKLVAFDFETADSNGASLEFYKPDFRALSAAFSWRNSKGQLSHAYCEGEQAIADQLRVIQEKGLKLAAHNAQFEYGVLQCRFPWFDRSLLEVDTQRLMQCYDSGGVDGRGKSENELSLEEQLLFLEGKLEIKTGLGLTSCAKRVLPKEWHNHKEPFYKYLREQHKVKKGQEGKHLHLLPPDMLEAYNTADTDITLLLGEAVQASFERIKYDWRFDHYLHMSAISRIVDAKIRGIPVDRKLLEDFVNVTEAEKAGIVAAFREFFANEIEFIETKRREAWVNSLATERGRSSRERTVFERPKMWRFNPRSTRQLKLLFVDTLGIEPKFWTKESKASKKKRDADPSLPPYVPNPSFKAAHMGTYGEGGSILEKLKKRELVSKQAKNLLKLSEFDGRWHFDLRACGTKTGRYTGGSSGPVKLNIQALSRKEKGLMSALLPEAGYTAVSIDLSAGEPTVVAHYSQDENYIATAFGMVGKEPYWKGDLLLLDDPYLSFASVSPLGAAEIRKAWDEGLFATWTKDSDAVKAKLKKLRAFHKTLFLALLYGQGPKGMVAFAADNGQVLALEMAKKVHTAFWKKLFPKVDGLGERLKLRFERQGYLVNAFGFRMVPEQARLALNYTIQSSVSGIMKIFEMKLLSATPWALYAGTIHDETIVFVPTERLDEFKVIAAKATDSLNDDLQWTVKIRTGFAPGNNLYEAK
jgi:hypothetical protein